MVTSKLFKVPNMLGLKTSLLFENSEFKSLEFINLIEHIFNFEISDWMPLSDSVSQQLN